MSSKPVTRELAIRAASIGDIPAIVAILARYREKLAEWAPQFWRPATAASAMSSFYLGSLLGKNGQIFLVAEEDGEVAGFALAMETPAPPVYAPGKTGTLDDFGVADDARWDDVGKRLLASVQAEARKAGWEQLIVVSPMADAQKVRVLTEAGLAVASQWWTTRL